MQQHTNEELVLDMNESYHNNLRTGLDMLEQEYALRHIDMPQSVTANINTLRNIINSTVNRDILELRFKRALANMGTWQEFFVIFGFNELAIKSYMNIILTSISKDTLIANLIAQRHDLTQQLKLLNEKSANNLSEISKQNKRELAALRREFNNDRRTLERSLANSNQEIRVLKQELSRVYTNVVSTTNKKISDLTAQSSAQMQQIAILQSELIKEKNSGTKNTGHKVDILSADTKVYKSKTGTDAKEKLTPKSVAKQEVLGVHIIANCSERNKPSAKEVVKI